MAFQEKEDDIGNKSVMEFKTAILYVKKMCKNTEKIEMEKNSQSNALFY